MDYIYTVVIVVMFVLKKHILIKQHFNAKIVTQNASFALVQLLIIAQVVKLT
jgi:hypothetical protein